MKPVARAWCERALCNHLGVLSVKTLLWEDWFISNILPDSGDGTQFESGLDSFRGVFESTTRHFCTVDPE